MIDLSKIFNPDSIAFVGATDRKDSVGLSIVENLLQGKKKRELFMVNPYRKKVKDYSTYPSLKNISQKIDLVIIATPQKAVKEVVKEACKKEVGGIIVITAGFSEASPEGTLVQKEIAAMCKEAGVPLVGPNCLGIIRPINKLNASFAPFTPKPGRISLISQSGALLDSIIDKAVYKDLGFANLVSYGNGADLSLNEFVQYLDRDEETKVIACYLEGLKRGREFLEVAKKVTKKTPIVALKAGVTEKGQESVSTHTASLAGDAEIYEAAFKQSGVIQVDSISELLNVSQGLAWQPKHQGGLGVVSNGGGMAVLTVDQAQKEDVFTPPLTNKTIKRLQKSDVFSQITSFENPLDIIGDASPERYYRAMDILMRQKDIGGIIVIQTTQSVTDVEENARKIIKIKDKYPKKPIVSVLFDGRMGHPGVDLLEKNKIPNYEDPKIAVQVIKHLLKDK